MTSATVDQLATALGQARTLLVNVRPEQWSSPTPCEQWDVRALVAHVVAGNRHVAAELRGQGVGQGGPGVGQGEPGVEQGGPGVEQGRAPEDDSVAAFEESGRAVAAAFGEPGALERIVRIPFGTVPAAVALHLRLTEILVHGWDLAHATGQAVPFDDPVAQREIEFSEGALRSLPPERRPFAPPRPAPPGASAVDRLAALLGRDVGGGEVVGR